MLCSVWMNKPVGPAFKIVTVLAPLAFNTRLELPKEFELSNVSVLVHCMLVNNVGV